MSERQLAGFTLVELMISLAILAVLATAMFPMIKLEQRRESERDLRVALRQIRTALDAYKKAVDDGHIERHIGDSGYPKNLEQLVEGVSDLKSVSGGKLYFLRKLPRDPLYFDPSVPASETWGLRSYDSTPEQPEPGKDVFDVYPTETGVGLDGVAYRDW